MLFMPRLGAIKFFCGLRRERSEFTEKKYACGASLFMTGKNRAADIYWEQAGEAGMDWWIWIVAALALLGIEIAAGNTFYVIFFAFGALFVGILQAVGIAGPLWLQMVLFAVSSAAALAVFRRPLFDRIREGTAQRTVDDVTQEIATAVEAIEPNAGGKAKLRGVPWDARNVGDRSIAAGCKCAVEKVDGLTLWIRAQ